jgi:hypothetical protein
VSFGVVWDWPARDSTSNVPVEARKLRLMITCRSLSGEVIGGYVCRFIDSLRLVPSGVRANLQWGDQRCVVLGCGTVRSAGGDIRRLNRCRDCPVVKLSLNSSWRGCSQVLGARVGPELFAGVRLRSVECRPPCGVQSRVWCWPVR